MRYTRFLTAFFGLAVLALMGAACGQLDENGRSVIYDARSVGAETVVLVVHSDLRIPEDVAVDLAQTIQLVDIGAPLQGRQIWDDKELGGMVYIEMSPPLQGLLPVVAPESRADYEALRDLVREYGRIEQVARELATGRTMDTLP